MSTLEAPKLRFPKFTGSWEKKSLGNIATFTKGAGISKEDITPSGNQKAIRYGELYTTYGETITDVKSKTNLESSQLVLSKANDVIIPASGETAIDIAIASCVLDDGIALSGDINIVRSSNNGVFLAYYLNNAKKLDIARRAQGVSVIHLYKSGLQSLDLYLPSNEEQNTIASFLSLVDENIKAMERKIALSKRYKVGVLQKLFPRKGQTNPGLRFKNDDGFSFPDWQETPLSSYIKDLKQKSVKQDEYPVMTSSRAGLVLQRDYYGSDNRITDRDNIGYNIIPSEHMTYRSRSDDGVFVFNVNGTKMTGIVSYFYPVFTVTDGSTRFFQEYLNYNWRHLYKFSVGTSQKVLAHTELKKVRIPMPCSDEQEKISEFLYSIDNEVADQERKLEQAKKFKKALLQQMFV